jgi:hypothetical protein
MGAQKFCREQAKNGLFIDYTEGQRIRGIIVNAAILRWQDRVKQQLRQSRWLSAPLGAKREFFGQLDDDMVREALSWLCQVTVAQVVTRAMLRLAPLPFRIVTQTHDSLLLNHDSNLNVIPLLQAAFDTEILLHGRRLIIPVEIAQGPNWGELSVIA